MSFASFPDFVKTNFSGFSKTLSSSVIRSEFERGIAKQRRYQSTVIIKRRINVLICGKDNLQKFINFINGDTQGGSYWFWIYAEDVKKTILARLTEHEFDFNPLEKQLDSWETSLQLESFE